MAVGESEPDGEGNGATQNTEGLNTGSLKDRLQSGGIADGQISQEVVKPPNSGLTTKNLTPEQIKQESEDADSALSLPDNRAGKKRKRSPSPLSKGKESLREDQEGGKRTTGEAGEVAEKANLFLETVESFIDYNRSARKLLHSDDIPRDVVFKVFNSKEDGNTSSRYGECLLIFSITY